MDYYDTINLNEKFNLKIYVVCDLRFTFVNMCECCGCVFSIFRTQNSIEIDNYLCAVCSLCVK